MRENPYQSRESSLSRLCISEMMKIHAFHSLETFSSSLVRKKFSPLSIFTNRKKRKSFPRSRIGYQLGKCCELGNIESIVGRVWIILSLIEKKLLRFNWGRFLNFLTVWRKISRKLENQQNFNLVRRDFVTFFLAPKEKNKKKYLIILWMRNWHSFGIFFLPQNVSK